MKEQMESASELPVIPLYAFVSDRPGQTQSNLVAVLAAYCRQAGYALTIVAPSPGAFASADHPVLTSTATAFLETVTSGAMEGVERAVLLSSPELLHDRTGRYGDILVVDLRTCVAGGSRALVRAMRRLDPKTTGPDGGVRDGAQDGAQVSLITSIFRAGDYMEGFLHNITGLEDYATFCDHLFLFCDLSGAEQKALFRHFEAAQNAVYIWHHTDPGLYECWNIGVRLADTTYVSNANVDDLRHPRQARALVAALKNTNGAAIAAAALLPFETYQPDYSLIATDNPWYADQAGRFYLSDLGFLKEKDGKTVLEPHCIPHCMPVWRRDLHDAYGYFDETTHGTYADWAFWMKVLRDDRQCGVLIKEPLSYYFINPDSHNRRGDKLQAFHEAVEAAFIDDFRADLERRRATRVAARAQGGYERKLNLLGREQNFGLHRNSFNRVIEALEPLNAGPEGIDFLPFIERTFVWGSDPGEASSANPQPMIRDWVGVLHVPFEAPQWFSPKISPERVFETRMWQGSLASCRGIICLCQDLALDFAAHYPEIAVLSVLHPTDLEARRFSFSRYTDRPRLVQAGDWLRRLQEIYRVAAPKHEKIMLLKADTIGYLEKDIAQFGDFRNDSVDLRKMISNGDYDDLLASAVVLCLLYGTAANNLVIECMARATPIIVNPLPGIVEYLGRDYPLYAQTADMAGRLLMDDAVIRAAHEYLLEQTPAAGVGYGDFLHGIGGSEFYRGL